MRILLIEANDVGRWVGGRVGPRVHVVPIALFDGFVPPLLGLARAAPETHLAVPGVAEEAPLRYILHHTMARGGQSLGLVLARA